MQNSKSCSIVIRCHNEEKHIGKLLTGIMNQTVKDVEIILIDSGSTDATLAIASRYPVKILNIKPDQFSFGRSLNIGCTAASTEFIVIISAHAYPVAKDWLEKMLMPLRDPAIALVYGKQRGNEITKYSEHKIFERWYPEKSNLYQSHPFCNNANAAIKKSIWERVRYNEELTELEDLDFAKRVIELGYKISYVAEATIIHVHNESPKRLYNRYKREAIAFKRIFPDERFHFYDFLRLLFSNIFTDYYHAWHDKVFMKNVISIPEFRFMQLWGTYRGFAYQGSVASQLKQTFYYPNEISKRKARPLEKDLENLIDYSAHQYEVKNE